MKVCIFAENLSNTFDRPCCLTDSVSFTTSQIPEERRRFADQGKEDWERILLHRAAELEKGYALGDFVFLKIVGNNSVQSIMHKNYTLLIMCIL